MKPGDIVTMNVDRVMIHDIFIPPVVNKLREMGFIGLWDVGEAVLVYDHLVSVSQVDDTRYFRVGGTFAEKYGLIHMYRSDGIYHQLMTEAGYVKPSDMALEVNSYTTTYDCVGAFSLGIGYAEMASIPGTGTMWVRVLETIKVVIDEKLPDHVVSKDIISRLIGGLGADGVTYHALEFSGSTAEAMSVSSRMTIVNMTVEAGAKYALFTSDEKMAEYCQAELTEEMRDIRGDEDMVYCRTIIYWAEDLVPVLAYSPQVDNIKPVSQLEGTPIDQVFIGSCIKGWLEDLVIAIGTLRGKGVAPYVRLIVTPASRRVYLEVAKLGVIDTLIVMGTTVTHPGCGLCCGRTGGILSDGEWVIATNNWNLLGQMGISKVEIFPASLAMAVTSAITGRIVAIV